MTVLLKYVGGVDDIHMFVFFLEHPLLLINKVRNAFPNLLVCAEPKVQFLCLSLISIKLGNMFRPFV